jgi:hypothetical protein
MGLKRKVLNFTRRLIGTENIGRKVDTILNAQFFQNSIAGCQWLKYKSFSPGGWAMDNAALYTIYRILNDVKPQNILEFGLGQSSRMIHQYATFNNGIKALTIEHDKEWINFFEKEFPEDIKLNIEQHDKVTVEYNGYETLTYGTMAELCKPVYDFIVTDGPFGSEHYSRSQIMSFVKTGLPDNFVLFFDDTEREGEKETIREVVNILDEQNVKYVTKEYNGEKNSHTVICTAEFKFLTSLR